MPTATQQQPLNPSDILTPEECAKRLKVRKTWLYEQRRSKKNRIPCMAVGRYLRFYWPDVSQWLAAQNERAR
jgi:excisionase family DNA binding protein